MVLADLGADVVRVERPGADVDLEDFMLRGRRCVEADLKSPEGRAAVLSLVEAADVLLEGYRPGVLERLGLGPDVCLARNPRLVIGRITGWGQQSPMSSMAGHDINYLGVTGTLHAIGRNGQAPVPPLNLVGDFGGGSMLLLVGVLTALWERGRSGRGQVVDAAMVDGVALLSAHMWALRAAGHWGPERGTNLLDSGAPFYDTYECADGRYVAVGPIEPGFYALMVDGLGLVAEDLPEQYDTARWPDLRAALRGAFLSRTRDEWSKVFDGTDACVTPVYDLDEAPLREPLLSRGTLALRDGAAQPAPAPRLSRTTATRPSSAVRCNMPTVLDEWTRPAYP
jgi:alpha-methylacyl-CoA racemase